MVSFRIRIPCSTTIKRHKNKTIDDLEMDIVAALEAQHLQRENGGAIGENGTIVVGAMDSLINNTSTGLTNSSPKEIRKIDSKKRWKNWSWKYSPGGKTSSIEEEPESPKKTSRHSSPTSSPKHKKSTSSEMTSASNVVANFIASSPLRRKNTNSAAASHNHNVARGDIRSSAGARLCQTLEDGQDESGDELQALLINGRPASVHIVPMSSSSSSPSTKPLINNNEVQK